jgi:hypothetical protein
MGLPLVKFVTDSIVAFSGLDASGETSNGIRVFNGPTCVFGKKRSTENVWKTFVQSLKTKNHKKMSGKPLFRKCLENLCSISP